MTQTTRCSSEEHRRNGDSTLAAPLQYLMCVARRYRSWDFGETRVQYGVSRSRSMGAPTNMQHALEAALSNYGRSYSPQCQNPNVGLGPKPGRPRPAFFLTVNSIHAPGGHDDVRSQSPPRGGPADGFSRGHHEPLIQPLRGLRPMHMGLWYLPGKPQYRSFTAKQSKKIHVQARWPSASRRTNNKIQLAESEVPEADGKGGELVDPSDKPDRQVLEDQIEVFNHLKETFERAINGHYVSNFFLGKYLMTMLYPPKKYLISKVRHGMQKGKKRQGDSKNVTYNFAIEMAVVVAKVVASQMRVVARAAVEEKAEKVQEVNRLGKTGKTEGAHGDAQPNRIEMLDHQLQPISKELAVGKRVFFDPNAQGYKHGIWDGDAVICNVMEQWFTLAERKAAADFNSEYVPKFKIGDHLYSECEPNMFGHRMYHHGIYDGKGYVYHFATHHPEVDVAYENCEECRARGIQRRKNLKSRGLGPSGIRKSCLYCFAEKDCMDKRREADLVNTTNKNQDPYISHIEYGIGLEAWKESKVPLSPIVCHNFTDRGAEKVVHEARTFYENDSFGTYSEKQNGMSHNCESFAYYCKTGIYSSHQVTEALFNMLTMKDSIKESCIKDDNSIKADISTEDGSIKDDSTKADHDIDQFITNMLFLLGTKVYLYVRGIDKISLAREKAEKANKAYPKLMPEALVPAELYVELRK
ncbi:hypothetical protein KC19_2G238700 [Ceratodon purpureus]|uniref:LRAT domain-containing protein n=2 Tax=Ceratodon purpureus TaxID=3225 RepID=A0A8T0IXB7_CERPU|nr:hypothetical protein KC19_2G238700 [Ceratodon purpureus]KAG0588369.1 hypothetical protein KC19_2G238700 [Ceratodon purpureus]KAG0588370.1 hypothetical protein KC19_2G238700 [Ceratodon purpureus]KAG0588374.1 hypothetical protein KC19_2G238700 [Ceratodon purpureus]